MRRSADGVCARFRSYLFYPPLAKACGSAYLQRRIDALQPSVHVFGHTHLGWDVTLDGVRYLQAPLSYPQERKQRLGTVACGAGFPHGTTCTPVLVYDASTRTFPERYDAGWSNFYATNPRRPELCHLLAPRAAARYNRKAGGAVGYFEPGDKRRVTPPWKYGPPNAVAREDNEQEAYD